eukprot:gnl/MRDRNA2_/MRDRNA2_75831_c0_seq3.p1 gnl/MRDRNA2_/MRDRNA2_75831_c0~~gnl/MRDRNA2_/MRDRNA2_75831_c0_seq3.p1  ORF type:complete len:167 (-),score=20.41 gnl/MRDRNA2_/MRDRNA2_75831_c0_seq3:151-651(-)
MGLPLPPKNFVDRAKLLANVGPRVAVTNCSNGLSYRKIRFVTVAEMRLWSPKEVSVEIVQENGNWKETHGNSISELRSTPWKVSPFVNRDVCSEAKALAELGAVLHGGHAKGTLFMYVSGTPCLSCIGLISQFRCIYPGVAMLFEFFCNDDASHLSSSASSKLSLS